MAGYTREMFRGIEKRIFPDGRVVYYAPVRYRDEANVQKKRWLGPFAKHDEADKARARNKAEKQPGQTSSPRSFTVAKMMAAYIDDRTLDREPKTVKNLRWLTDTYIIPILGKIPMDNLSSEDVMNFKRSLLKCARIGDSTRRNAFSTLHAACRDWSERHGKPSPVSFVKPINYYPLKRPTYDLSDLERVFASCDAFMVLGAPIRFIAYSGLCEAEVLALEWEDVDFEAGIFRVGKSKTLSGRRDIPLVEPALSFLRDWRASQPARPFSNRGGWVFPAIKGGPYRATQMREDWGRYRLKAGYPTTTIHDLRHAFSTTFLHAGGSVEQLSRILGHSNSGITRRVYEHILDEDRRAGMERLGEAWTARATANSQLG